MYRYVYKICNFETVRTWFTFSSNFSDFTPVYSKRVGNRGAGGRGAAANNVSPYQTNPGFSSTPNNGYSYNQQQQQGAGQNASAPRGGAPFRPQQKYPTGKI